MSVLLSALSAVPGTQEISIKKFHEQMNKKDSQRRIAPVRRGTV